MYRNCPVTITGKIVHVNIEVIDAFLDYNNLLGHIYTYAMSSIVFAVFCKMCFPHEGNIIALNQLTYYKPTFVTSPKSIISSMSNK